MRKGLLPTKIHRIPDTKQMDYFNYKNDALFAEQVSMTEIASHFGTPCYVYSKATLERHWHAFNDAFGNYPHLICYAVKANSNLAVLNVLAQLGSGFDIVSVGELERVLEAGGLPENIVFSGVGKRSDELLRALEVGIRCFNIEVQEELFRLDRLAASLNCKAPVSIRVNPDVDAHTHPYIATGLKGNKFGIDIRDATQVYRQASQLKNIEVKGIDCHIGSQLTDVAPFIDALQRVLNLVDSLAELNIPIQHIDIGGGLGIRYKDEVPPEPGDYARSLFDQLGQRKLEVLLEPGRAIAGNSGILLTQVEYLKPTRDKQFAIVDSAMNDLIRPSLYDAWQEIIPVNKNSPATECCYDIVGPVCETGDFLGKARTLKISEGDLLAIRSAGAYGFTMSSNYNSRPRAAEVMVDGDRMHLIRKRESISSLWAGERVLP